MFTASVVDDDDNRVARGSQESRFAVFWIFPALVLDLLLVLRVDIVDIDVVGFLAIPAKIRTPLIQQYKQFNPGCLLNV